ncbi:MAG: hypothetical protein COV75_00570 [Candidatus Omnitrophica bacterium CG11_big_fil_rev_8_21_14_0_20_63_9]|nr:MAG: hypothetical protein COV75_00570 [Candidatus Omnitrophica bacterium CG11_big_fil_rev_8_21_14_0_20_63_9]
MVIGLFFVVMGILILLNPAVLVAMVALLFIMIGMGIMAMSWQFRRMHRRSESQFVNWITRF